MRILKYFGALVALLLVLGIGVISINGWRSLPDLSGSGRITGLSAPVEILRDKKGVPYITAQNIPDAMAALGYAHAQDRLWQMELVRRVGQGRLAEIFGARAVTIDTIMRTLDLAGLTQRALPNLSEEAQRALEAYTRGVNAVLQANDRPLPIEFQLLWHKPEPWAPSDSLLVLKLFAVNLSGNALSELNRARLLSKHEASTVQSLWPPYPATGATTLGKLAGLALPGFDVAKLFDGTPEELLQGASNAWVVSPAKSESGKPLLANDPHLGLTAPGVMYLAHITVAGRKIAGATAPGLPAVLLGTTDSVAWGFTTTNADTQDLYLEKIDPASPDNYLTPNGPAAFEERRETIQVRFAEQAETITVRKTRHGPVIPAIDPSVAQATPSGHVLALAWPALLEGDTTYDSALRVMQASNGRDLREALRYYRGPIQNIVYADSSGVIGFIAPGLIPIRRADNEAQGRVPVPGWDAKYDWTGFIPFDQLPQGTEPAKGYYATANNKIVDSTYPYLITHDWDAPYRADRIEQFLRDTGVRFNAARFKGIMADRFSQMAASILPAMIAVPPKGDRQLRAWELMSVWNKLMDPDKPEPLIYIAWHRALISRLLRANLPGDADRLISLRPLLLAQIVNNENGMGSWCFIDGRRGADVCPAVINAALDDALNELEDRFGTSMNDWQWGKAHPAVSRHIPFGFVPVVGRLFDISVPSGGGYDTVDRGSHSISGSEAYQNRHAAVYRAIYDLGNPSASLWTLAGGQSGNIFSSHYSDQAKDWAAGRFMQVHQDRERLLAEGARRLNLSGQ